MSLTPTIKNNKYLQPSTCVLHSLEWQYMEEKIGCKNDYYSSRSLSNSVCSTGSYVSKHIRTRGSFRECMHRSDLYHSSTHIVFTWIPGSFIIAAITFSKLKFQKPAHKVALLVF